MQNWNDNSGQPYSAQGAPAPRRKRRVGSALLLGLALTSGAVGGAAAGVGIGARWLAPQEASASVVTAQPIAQVEPGNVAGAVLNAVGPSVVEVSTSGGIGGQGRFAPSGTGSGFVVDTDGLILTNNHVVSGNNTVSVEFSNGETRTASVLGTDMSNDLALLQVDNMPTGIPAAALGDSSQVEVGETAIAIGSPFGLDQTVTQGIVSAINRNWAPGGTLLRGLIQTDAPINPGNSGGPLLNAAGEVIGINTLIESPVSGNVGVGFAVPINIAKQQLERLEDGASLQQGYLGIAIQDAAALSDDGVTIGSVDEGSGADQAGLQAGDVITAIDGVAVTDYESLVARISGKQPGDEVTVTYQRNGQEQEATVTLQARVQS